MHRTFLALAFLPLLGSCIQDSGRGPQLGDCALPPEGSYTFGEVGIGTCLAGPADMEFFEQGGSTYLAVTNANPFLNFESGSLLLLDWAAIEAGVAEGRGTLFTHEVAAGSLVMDNYVGGVGFEPDKGLLMVAGRYTEDSLTRTGSDQLWLVDVADPTAPVQWATNGSVTLRDDPQPVVVDAATDTAWVVNITDHSISVIDTSGDVSAVDVAPAARILPETFDDTDASGSRAEIAREVLIQDTTVTEDVWTLEWVDGSYRVWVPSERGLDRWVSGGPTYSPTTLGIDQGDLLVDEPYGFIDGGVLGMYFTDGTDIRRVFSQGTAGDWVVSAASTLVQASPGTWYQSARAPSPVAVGLDTAIYFEGVDAMGVSSIGAAWFDPIAGDYSVDAQPLITTPDGYDRVAQPFAVYDNALDAVRIWAAVFDGTSWSLAHTSSDDGMVFGELEPVLSIDGGHAAAPTVAYVGSRYVLWTTISTDDATWQHATAWSWDGLEWYDLEPVIDSELAFVVDRPPRLAAVADSTSGWTVEGLSSGLINNTAVAGTTFATTTHGFSFRVANGYEASFTLVGDSIASQGIEPSSVVEVAGVRRMFVTARDDEGTPSIHALDATPAGWTLAGQDLISGAESPVVWLHDAQWQMVYGRTDEFGVTRMYGATSFDALSWTDTGPLLDTGEDFDAFGQFPRRVQRLGNGIIRVWYTGDNGSRTRIAAATGPVGGPLVLQEGDRFPWQFEAGLPGTFDGSSVRDPFVVSRNGVDHLWYSAFDGTEWSLGHATRPTDTLDWERDTDSTGETGPALSGLARTFSAGGVRAPVLVSNDDRWDLYYAGNDGVSDRIGLATGTLSSVFAAQAFPTAGDRLTFRSKRGEEGTAVIELEAVFDDVAVAGTGLTEARHDSERGLLWVTSKLWNYIYAVDIRDDSAGDVEDANFHDIEAALFNGAGPARQGFRDALPIPGTDLLYATARSPDQLLVFDVSGLIDDSRKDALLYTPVASFPLQAQNTPTGTTNQFGIAANGSRDEDRGAETWSAIGGAGLALVGDDLLLVSHFRDNSVTLWDLSLGAYGEPISRVDFVGENPHRIEVSPDQRLAVIANYVGELDENTASSTLAVLDVDRTSPTFGRVRTWIENK